MQNVLGCDNISVGQLIRSLYTNERILQNNIPSLELDTIVAQQLKKTNTNLIVLDNYPSTETQLTLWLATKQLPAIVFFLDLSPADAKIRRFMRGRSDNTIEQTTIREQIFETQTRQLIDFYNRKNIIVTLDARKKNRRIN